MKRLAILSAMQLVIAFLFSAAVSAQQFNASTTDTKVTWEGSKVVGGSHTGTIALKEGSLTLKDGAPVSGTIIIDMASLIDTDLEGGMKERLEGHLKSDDFFGVEKYPTAKLVVKGANESSPGVYSVTGDLTIKGKTGSVTFNAKSADGNGSKRFTGTIEIDRSEYDVRYGSGKFFDDLGDRAINDIFTLEFDLYLVK